MWMHVHLCIWNIHGLNGNVFSFSDNPYDYGEKQNFVLVLYFNYHETA